MKIVTFAATAMILSACASMPGPEAAASSDARVVCSREAPTGTTIAVVRCRTIEAIEERRANDRELAERLPVQPHDVLTGR